MVRASPPRPELGPMVLCSCIVPLIDRWAVPAYNIYGFPGSSNGRTRAFGARYPGSNPGPGAIFAFLRKIPRALICAGLELDRPPTLYRCNSDNGVSIPTGPFGPVQPVRSAIRLRSNSAFQSPPVLSDRCNTRPRGQVATVNPFQSPPVLSDRCNAAMLNDHNVPTKFQSPPVLSDRCNFFRIALKMRDFGGFNPHRSFRTGATRALGD